MNDNRQQLTELLRQARKILNDDYLQNQNNAYSRWKVECDATWLSKGMMLPYPAAGVFPSEQEVIAKALELYNQLNPAPTAPPLVNIEPMEQPAILDPIAAPVLAIFNAPIIEPEIEEILPDEVIEETPTEIVEESVVDDETPSEEAEEVQRTSRLRKLLSKFMATATELESKNTKGNQDDVQ